MDRCLPLGSQPSQASSSMQSSSKKPCQTFTSSSCVRCLVLVDSF